MTVFEPLRRGAEELAESVAEGWDWLRTRGANAVTRFRRSRDDEEALPAMYQGDRWGLLASDIAELDDEVVVRIEVPGLEEKDLSVTVVEGQLLVRGQKRFERESRKAQYHLFESAYGAFERRLPLPCEIDSEHANARYRNGVLTIRLPRAESAKRRRIQVKAT